MPNGTSKASTADLIVDPEALELLQEAMAGARPVRDPRHPAVLEKPKPLPVPQQRLRDEQEALELSQLSDFTPDTLLDSDETLSFTRPGVGADTLRRLRRGHWSIRAELDLHGYRTEEAREAFSQFIRACFQSDRRCVRIIHGKGLGSVGREPVLKAKVQSWLRQKGEVLAYCQAPPAQGGAGAVLVLLKSAR